MELIVPFGFTIRINYPALSEIPPWDHYLDSDFKGNFRHGEAGFCDFVELFLKNGPPNLAPLLRNGPTDIASTERQKNRKTGRQHDKEKTQMEERGLELSLSLLGDNMSKVRIAVNKVPLK